MKYIVEPYIFDKNPDLNFGIIIGKNLKNTKTSEKDHEALLNAEKSLRDSIPLEALKTHPTYLSYRQALKSFNINPNKFQNSIEAMSKRILKGQSLPRINALVDSCNTIGLTYGVSLGGHDLKDIHEDLQVRLSTDNDVFLPFASQTSENLTPGELVFTSGHKVQTRHWLWRQSEIGKLTLDSKDIFFQLVGFDSRKEALENAMTALENLITERFGGEYESFVVNKDKKIIEFKTT